jgi:phosphohistidine phosphatase SixA
VAGAPRHGGRRAARRRCDAHRPLVAKGIDQARRLAAALDGLGVRPDRVLCSPWLRAVATAELLHEAARPHAAAPTHLDALAAPDAAAQSAAIAAACAATTGSSPWSGTNPG